MFNLQKSKTKNFKGKQIFIKFWSSRFYYCAAGVNNAGEPPALRQKFPRLGAPEMVAPDAGEMSQTEGVRSCRLLSLSKQRLRCSVLKA